jgi:lysophospholipase L1-like esterase
MQDHLVHPRVGLIDTGEAVDAARNEPRSSAKQGGGSCQSALVGQGIAVQASRSHGMHQRDYRTTADRRQCGRLPAGDEPRYPDPVKRPRSAQLLGPLLLVVAVPAALTFASHGARPQSGNTRIVLVGDSTVTDDSGWGTGFRRLMADGVEVINTAANGRSSKSFIDEGRWAEALAKRGQYYLIQFGHNDEPGKGPERETDPKTTYRANMARYVDDARAIGAKPILVTSLVRRLYKEDGTIRTTQTPYVEVVRALAAEKKVPLVDLHAISLADAENAGDDVWADLSPRDDKGQVDRTHLNAKGSEVVGRMVVEALRSAVPDLAPMLRLTTGSR